MLINTSAVPFAARSRPTTRRVRAVLLFANARVPESELEHPTWDEIDALEAAAREREQYLRFVGRFDSEWYRTDAIESLLGKLRRNFHARRRDVR